PGSDLRCPWGPRPSPATCRAARARTPAGPGGPRAHSSIPAPLDSTLGTFVSPRQVVHEPVAGTISPGGTSQWQLGDKSEAREEMSAPNKSYDPVEVEALKPEEIERMRDEALAAFAAADSLDALHEAKVAHPGPASPLAPANREIGALPPHAKAEAGKRVGQARGAVNKGLAARQAELEAERDARVLVEESVDVTLPYDRTAPGARHPLTTLSERIEDIFVAMGYEVAEGPQVEAAWFNFDALNIGPDHPARGEHDTFFVQGPEGGTESGVVLRTHTSPVQIRSLLDRELPVYVICPGRVYRTDELDATHTPVFHQVELLAVDEGLTMSDLKGTLDHMVQSLFGEGMKTRLRPNFFPFTEPSAEMDMLCYVCKGESVGNPDRPCRTCSSEGWIELGGC